MKLFAKFLVPVAALALGGAACGGKKPVEPTPAEVAPTAAPEADAAAPAPDAAAPAPDAAAPAPDAAAPAPDAAAVAPDAAAAAGDAAPAGDAAAAAADVAAAADAVAVVDFVRVVVNHHDATKGLVTAEFKTFKVVEANIDLTKLDTAKAVIEVDATSVATGNADRDTHVKSPDLLEVDKFAKVTITVDRIKPVADMVDTYDATGTLDLHGIKKEVPVQFKVVEKKADGAIVVEGEVKDLPRADWGIAAPPEKINVGPTFTAQVRLTVTNVTPEPAPTPAPAPK